MIYSRNNPWKNDCNTIAKTGLRSTILSVPDVVCREEAFCPYLTLCAEKKPSTTVVKPIVDSCIGDRKGFMAALATTEVCDTYPSLVANGELRVLQPIFQIYGRRQAFSGPIVTVKVFEDSVLLRECLEERGNGRVLIVDGGGSTRCCILGGNVVVSAQNNGWAGIIVNGCIRDVDEINRCDIGVRALAAHPLKANKKGVGEKNVPIYVAGTRILPAEWCYTDNDGVLVSQQELSL